MDSQIIEDFGDPSLSSHGSEDRQAEEDVLMVRNEEVRERSIPSITAEEYPWVDTTVQNIESGTENRSN